MPLLEVRDLAVRYTAPAGAVHAVRGVSFDLEAGGALAVVGESGSGKSSLVAALAGMSPPEATVRGSARLEGRELLDLDAPAWRSLRGRSLGVLFQETGEAMDPTMPVGRQLAEVYGFHAGLPHRAARARAAEALTAMGLPDWAADAYPHMLSGGMRRRALLALALAGEPSVLLADEPTAGLDATVARQISGLLASLRRDRGLALLLVTHQLGLVARVADRVLVLYGGTAVEQGPVPSVLSRPAHPYTQALLAAAPPAPGTAVHPPRVLGGRAPDARAEPAGCPFAPRCLRAFARCEEALPPAFAAAPEAPAHAVRCFLAADNGPGELR